MTDDTGAESRAVPPASAPRASYLSVTRLGLVITTLSRGTVQLSQLAGSIVLARVLGPDAYGLVAIVAVFAGFTKIFTDLGLGAAIVQKETLSPSDLSTVFWVNVVSGFILTGAFAGIAVPMANFYGRPELVILMLVTSLSFALAVSVVPMSLLQRQFRFATIAKIEISSSLAGLVVAIVLALTGAGALSLVLSALSITISNTLFSWATVRWWPSARPSRQSMAEIWRFSAPLVGFNVVNYWSSNIDNLVVGRIGGSVSLAYYSRAYNLMLIPISQVQQITDRVVYPIFSELRADPERLARAYVKSITASFTLSAPLCVGLASCSSSTVVVLYGDQWSPTAPILAFLALAAPAIIVGSSVSVALRALGMTGLQFRRGIVSMLTTIVAVAVGINWGALGVAIALCLRAYATFPLNFVPTIRRLNIDGGALARSLAPVVALAVFMGGIVFGIGQLLHERSDVTVLVVQVLSGALTYMFGLRMVLPKRYRELRMLIRGQLE